MDPYLIPVKLPHSSYDILLQSAEGPPGHSLIQLGSQMRARGLSGRALVVSHPGIAKHFAEKLLQGLQQAGFAAHLCLLPAGERYKTLRSVAKIYDAALAFGLERSSTLVALGGGVIGDIVGFAAATWLRGIPFVQVPHLTFGHGGCGHWWQDRCQPSWREKPHWGVLSAAPGVD
jgi:3-dehydroquinate synthase